MIFFEIAVGVVNAKFIEAIPAALIKPETSDLFDLIFLATAFMSSGEVTSQRIAGKEISDTSLASPKTSRPFPNNLSHIALPSPLLAPVTTIIFDHSFVLKTH